MSGDDDDDNNRLNEAKELQNDEILALQAIYGDESIKLITSQNIQQQKERDQSISYILTIPLDDMMAKITIQIYYPLLYPLDGIDSIPVYQILETIDANVPSATRNTDPGKMPRSMIYPERKLIITNEMSTKIHEILVDLMENSCGSVVLFEWISQICSDVFETEWPKPLGPIIPIQDDIVNTDLEKLTIIGNSDEDEDDDQDHNRDRQKSNSHPPKAITPQHSASMTDITKQLEQDLGLILTTGPEIVDRKSVFVGHVVGNLNTDSKHVLAKINGLLLSNNKIAKATHNVVAYRIELPQTKGHNEGSVISQDCDDDGETAAGSRLLHLLQLLEVKNVMVVVSRWYGGVKLGPDRFKHINNAARQALIVSGHLSNESGSGGGSSKGSGKKKK
ncbi:hypothetical protein H4219_004615 [Mycoemilia scoparia]|uniref:RWD domain-containing protein n=1 Tax=Mycoemilia scoparia TaxID=417184 RepID=A0A9W8DL82_9FUNG|nr:hypothetical protein H4219_004615 [Mycoemilia scoparia]